MGYFLRRWASGLSANTSQAAAAASKLFHVPRESVRVIYNGIDYALLEPKKSREQVLREIGVSGSDATWIGVSANLRSWKRIDRLLAAVHAINDRSVRCLVIGDGPDRQRLEALSATLSIADRTIFTGQKEHVGDYLQLLDIFVLPSGEEE